ncbi:Ig-like domain-containing protein [Halalkaliarchaeum desulfuricum]|nr:Ig-like domain-containing protein [Halalkaliarchaeum desulfuricum]
MRFWGDDRAQALQVGAVLLFGFLIVGLAVYQVSVVPEENRQVEFDAYQDAASDMADLRGDVLTSATRDVTTTRSVKTGARYPPRVVFVNPPPATGSLGLGDSTTVTIENAHAINSEDTNTQEYWNGTAREFETKPARFTPSYSNFEGLPVVVTGESSFRDAGDNLVPVGGQTLLQGDRLQLIAIDGEMDANGLETQVTTEPISAAERTVVVEGEGDEDIVVEIAPGGDPDAWNETFGERLLDREDVVAVEARDETVAVTLDGDRAYRLRLGKVELRERGDVVSADEPGVAYVVAKSDENSTIAQGSSKQLRVEVRDAFNNPKSGVDVEFESDDGTLTPTETVSTEDGEASTTFEPSAGFTGEAEIVATVPDAGDGVDEKTFTVNVIDPEGGEDTGSGLNPNEPTRVALTGAETTQNTDWVDITLQNNGDNVRSVDFARVNFYYLDTPGRGGDGGRDMPETATFTDPEREPSLSVGGSFESLSEPIDLEANDETTLRLEFDESVEGGDFFILSVIYEDGESATYFVAPR